MTELSGKNLFILILKYLFDFLYLRFGQELILTIHAKWLQMEPRQMDQRASQLLEKRLLAYEKPDIDFQLKKFYQLHPGYAQDKKEVSQEDV